MTAGTGASSISWGQFGRVIVAMTPQDANRVRYAPTLTTQRIMVQKMWPIGGGWKTGRDRAPSRSGSVPGVRRRRVGHVPQ